MRDAELNERFSRGRLGLQLQKLWVDNIVLYKYESSFIGKLHGLLWTLLALVTVSPYSSLLGKNVAAEGIYWEICEEGLDRSLNTAFLSHLL